MDSKNEGVEIALTILTPLNSKGEYLENKYNTDYSFEPCITIY